MKKISIIALIAAVSASSAMAQMEKEPVEVTAEVALMSAYVWRGQVYNEGAVLQPQLTLAQHGISFNIWGNIDMANNVAGNSGDLSEIDLTLAYTLPIDINEMTIDFGVISYQFPANVDGDPEPKSNAEFFTTATVNSFPVIIPSFSIFADFKEVDGAYFLVDVVAPFEISEYLSVEAGASVGYGSTSYNTFYWSTEEDAGANDYKIYANGSYELTDDIVVSGSLAYSTIDGSRDHSNYEAKEQFFVGTSFAYQF